MSKWDWLTKQQYDKRFVRNVFIKTLVLFLVANALYIALKPLPFLSRVTFYNTIIPARERLPFSENPDDAYSLSLQRIEGMFASHEINQRKGDNEFRVVFIGDSSVWGWLLESDQTLTACLNTQNLQTADGRDIVAYNLGYPVLSLMKDTLILDYALENYDVDAVVWLVSLQSFFTHEQVRHPISSNNPERTRDIIETYNLNLDVSFIEMDENLIDRSIYGQRRELADLLRYQVYGVAWWLTGIDHTNPLFYRIRDDAALGDGGVEGNDSIAPNSDLVEYFSLDVVDAVQRMTTERNTPIVMINEPILRLDESANPTRYNYYYPRSMYDAYRVVLNDYTSQNGWMYLDQWDAIPNEDFTDTPLHYTPAATCTYAANLGQTVIDLGNLPPQ